MPYSFDPAQSRKLLVNRLGGSYTQQPSGLPSGAMYNSDTNTILPPPPVQQRGAGTTSTPQASPVSPYNISPSYDYTPPPRTASFGGGGSSSSSTSGPSNTLDMALSALRRLSSAAEPVAFSLPNQVKYASATDPTSTQNAIFAQAKTRAGLLARSGLESLRAELADRGILGGGTEAQGIARGVVEASNPLSELNVAQQGESLTQARHEADTTYQGGIAMRGQDIGAQQADAERRQQHKLALLQAALNGMRLY